MNSNAKIYKNRQILSGVFWGGPLVGGYLIAKNFQVFGEPTKAKKTWIIAIITTILIFTIGFFAPFVDKIPNYLFPLVYSGITYYLMRIYQGEKIENHINTNGKIYSWWNVVTVSIIGGVLTLAIGLGIIYLSGGFSDSTTYKYYGNLKHEIGFDENNVSESDIDKIADVFKKQQFFDNELQKFIYVKKFENTYEISIYCNNSIKNNSDGINWFIDSKNNLQKSFPNNKIVYILVIEKLENIVKRLE